MEIIDRIKGRLAEGQARRDAERAAYRDAFHTARIEALKKKAAEDAARTVASKKGSGFGAELAGVGKRANTAVDQLIGMPPGRKGKENRWI